MAITPLRAIRMKCLDCSGDSAKAVRLCPATGCPIHPIRSGKNGGKVKSVLKSIRAKCLDCSDGHKDVAECALEDCPLFPFRMGTNPNRRGATIPKGKRTCSEYKKCPSRSIFEVGNEITTKGRPQATRAGFSGLGD